MINVRDFNAKGDGLTDDTNAIQSALDSINTASGATSSGKQISGDVCFLPHGVYLISRPLILRSGITLKGEGHFSKIVAINCHAIMLNTPFTHAYWECGGLEDLSIYTEGLVDKTTANNKAKGVLCDSSIGDITALTMKNVSMECEGLCIDLSGVYSQNCVFDNIQAMNGGAGLVSISGNCNFMNRLNTEGSARPNLTVDTAVVIVKGGGNSITNSIIEGFPAGHTAFYVSGTIYWRNNHMECPPGADQVCYIFQNCGGHIDDLHLMGASLKAKFIDCQNLEIGSIDFVGFGGSLRDSFIFDATTSLKIHHVFADFDCGELDNPRIQIDSVFSKRNNQMLRNPIQLKNCVPSNAFSSPSVWAKNFGSKNTIVFDVSTDNAPGRLGRRLKVVVKANPDNDSFGVQLPLGVSADDTGTPGVAKYHLEGPSQLITWQIQGANWQQVPTRVMGSLTSARLPLPLLTGDSLIFIGSGAKAGDTFYISGLEVGPELF